METSNNLFENIFTPEQLKDYDSFCNKIKGEMTMFGSANIKIPDSLLEFFPESKDGEYELSQKDINEFTNSQHYKEKTQPMIDEYKKNNKL